MNWLSKGIVCHKELVVPRDGCRTRGNGCREELVVATKWLSRGNGCREEMVVARKWLSPGIGCRQKLVVARNWLSPGIGCRQELVVARNWLSRGIGCRTGLVAPFSRLLRYTRGCGGANSNPAIPTGIARIGRKRIVAMNWLSKGIVCHKELVVPRDCRTRWLQKAMLVARNW